MARAGAQAEELDQVEILRANCSGKARLNGRGQSPVAQLIPCHAARALRPMDCQLLREDREQKPRGTESVEGLEGVIGTGVVLR